MEGCITLQIITNKTPTPCKEQYFVINFSKFLIFKTKLEETSSSTHTFPCKTCSSFHIISKFSDSFPSSLSMLFENSNFLKWMTFSACLYLHMAFLLKQLTLAKIHENWNLQLCTLLTNMTFGFVFWVLFEKFFFHFVDFFFGWILKENVDSTLWREESMCVFGALKMWLNCEKSIFQKVHG